MRGVALAAALACAAPALAQPAEVAPTLAAPASAPSWPGVFAALQARDWVAAGAMIDALPDDPRKPFARAELYLGSGAPGVDVQTIAALVAAAPALPQAPALAALARARGAAVVALPPEQDLLRTAGVSKRQVARANRADADYQQLARLVQPMIKAGDLAAAEPAIEDAAPTLAPEALAEWRQRLAWAYYQAGDDLSARRVATLARGGAGEWAVQGAWVAGLAAWRSSDFTGAAEAFADVGRNAGDGESIAAGLYWSARANTAAGRPQAVAPLLRDAARRSETFYGMLAAAMLGTATPPYAPPPAASEGLSRRPNLQAAAAFAAMGDSMHADALIRRQARIGPTTEHAQLIAFAGKLGLPETQVWLAQNCPAGARSLLPARYPMPVFAPSGGWRVDRSLIFAHALQESRFRVDAVSPAGARGLMQLMPGTARMVARHRGDPDGAEARLGDPALNFEYGQSYLEELAGHAGTGGLLPKVIAAYNAGPNNVALWNLKAQVQNDPLLFIETIPFTETRNYVAIVLRNYWMYQREAGEPSASLTTLAQEKWPRFPSQAVERSATLPARDVASSGAVVRGGG